MFEPGTGTPDDDREPRSPGGDLPEDDTPGDPAPTPTDSGAGAAPADPGAGTEPADRDGGREPDPAEDDLDGYETPMSRFTQRAGGWIGGLLALLLVVPLGGWLFDEVAYRLRGDAIVDTLGEDARLPDAVWLVRTSGCDATSGSGTAFAMLVGDEPVLVTNAHVVAGAGTVTVRSLAGGPAHEVTGVRTATTADVAVLRLADPTVASTVVPPGRDPLVGQEVRVVGFPAARPYTTAGQVAEVGVGALALDLRVDPGASGSPVVDAEGRIVGQVFARTADGRGIATPVDDVLQAIADADPTPLGCG